MNFPSPDLVPGEGDIRHSWRQTNEARDAARKLNSHRVANLERIGDIRRRFTMAGYDFHPFKIYLAQLAFADAANPTADPTTWWRTFLVRCGEIDGLPLSGDGCDGWDVEPHDDYIPQEVGDDESGKALTPVTIPDATSEYFFWIELTQAGPTLRTGPNPATSTVDGTGHAIKNPWLNYPQPDGLHFIIAQIDTSTNTATKGPALIRQYLTADIIPGMLIAACDETGAALNLRLPFACLDQPPK